MILPFIIPVIAAAAGGGIAYASGAAILTGMAVGWMVGSWLFPMGGGEFDPGAQELQDVNAALRGTDLSILFGTNRVQSNVILRANFDSDKKTKKSGGFFGIGGKKQTTGYEYFLDLILHLGIPHNDEGFQVFAIWWDGEIISSDALSRWTERVTGGDQVLLTKSSASAEISKFLNQDGAGAHPLNFDSAHFSGGTTSTALWSEISALTSDQPVRWPRTVWAGFKTLDLEEVARVPALSFEVGPASDSGLLTAKEEEGLINTTSLENIEVGTFLDKNGAAWMFNNDNLRVVSASGTVLYTAAESEWLGRLQDLGFISTSHTIGNAAAFQMVQPILNGEKIVVVYKSNFSAAPFLNCTIVNPITVPSSPEIKGSVWTRDSGTGFSRGDGHLIDHAHLKDEGDPIIAAFSGRLSLGEWGSFVFPDPRGIQNGTYANSGGWGASSIGDISSTTATWSKHEVPRIEYILPYTSVHFDDNYEGGGAEARDRGYVFFLPRNLDNAVKTTMWFPALASVHQYHSGSGSQPWAIYQNSISLALSADGGGAFYYVLDTHSADELKYFNVLPPSDDLGAKTWDYTMRGHFFGSSNFVDNFNEVVMPFSDDQLTLNNSIDLNSMYRPHPLIQKENDDTWCLAWMKTWTDSSDNSNGFTTKIRGFTYSRATGKFTQFADAVNTVTLPSSFDPLENDLDRQWNRYGFGTVTSEQLLVTWAVGNHVIATDWGFLDCTVAGDKVDLTPPDIIKHIMTNSVYGLDFPSSIIDGESFDDSVAYCNTEGFFISGIYRTSQGRANYIEHLLATYGGYLVWSRGKLKFGFVTGSDTIVRTLDNDHHAVQREGEPPIKIAKGSRQDTFNKVSVHYLDRRLAYRKNTVEIADEADIEDTGVRVREFPARFVMQEAMASKIAHRTLWAGLYARDLYQGFLGHKDSDLEPGDLVWLVDSHHPELSSGVRARLTSIEERRPGLIAYNATQEDVGFLNDPGFVASETLSSPSAGFVPAALPVDFQAFEVPKEFAPSPAVYFGWYPSVKPAGARLFTSNASDGTFTQVLELNEFAIAGRLEQGMGGGPDFVVRPSFLFVPTSDHTVNTPDLAYTITLSNVTPTDRAGGDALMLVGSEVIAVESLTSIGSNQYRASRAYRGWGGTHVHEHSSGDVFYWLDEAILSRDFVQTEIGKRFFYKVVPFDLLGGEADISSIQAKEHTIRGTYFGPQVTGCLHPIVNSEDHRGNDKFGVASGDNIVFEWKDAAPLAGYGAGAYGNAGYGHFSVDPTSHNWEVVITGSGETVVRTALATNPSFTYTHSANAADNGAFGPFAIAITPTNADADATETLVRTLEVFEK